MVDVIEMLGLTEDEAMSCADYLMSRTTVGRSDGMDVIAVPAAKATRWTP